MKGTIFENTHVPLKSWFLAIYLMATNKAGTSAKQIEREVGVSYPTAWKMMHDIRSLMQPPDKQLAGEVEIDETYLHANTYKRSSARKRYGFDARRTGEVVVGMVERGGAVKVWHVKAAGARVLHPLIARNVRQGTLIHTDGYIAYRSLPRMGYQHRWTEHGKGEYYREDSYTQNIENVWSHFKRGIKGVYRHIGPKYVQAYANEYAWRYSNRKRANMFWALMCRIDKR
ncbi:MAG TPA: IS1595 family transposase [Verrucomicrobiae bacterium]|nr:IS1595 family transposase [Verrucomicrobiae bacterium]